MTYSTPLRLARRGLGLGSLPRDITRVLQGQGPRRRPSLPAHHLLDLDDHLLEDIGLTREDVRRSFGADARRRK
jgi:hypothetical protein